MKLIIGLGNPGKKYEKTRHNIGFRVVSELASRFQAVFEKKEKLSAEVALLESRGQKILLAKPQTFMNESGRAVAKLLKYYKLPIINLLIIHDEIDLPFGTMRLSQGSGSAGHKGTESIINTMGQNFSRLRMGIENRAISRVPDTEAYVLQNFTPEEEQILKNKIIPEALKKISVF